MNLLTFHRFLITTAVFFCGGYAAWEFVRYSREGETGMLVQAIVFAALAVGLIVYFNRMARFLGYREEE